MRRCPTVPSDAYPIRKEAIGYLSDEDRADLSKKIEMFNRGLRWFEVIPPDVDVIAKS